LNPNSADFGYSWSFTVTDLGVTMDEQRSEVQDVVDGTFFSLRTGGGRDITLDMPDTGRRVTFSYSLGGGGAFKLQASWTPPPGVNATLVPTVSPNMVSLFGLNYWEAAPLETSLDNFDFPGFILTTRDGTQYRLDREDLGTHFIASDSAIGSYAEAYGQFYLSRITSQDQSHTDFVRDRTALRNIEQYDASNQKLKSILFVRDGQSRIVGVYTPENVNSNGVPIGPASVAYEYDSIGNLVRVERLTDSTSTPSSAQYTTNSYVYANPQFPHLLTEVIDSRGIAVMRAEFDASGRLIGTFDAAGNKIQIVHDPSGRSETVYDKLGNPTTYTYDDNGRVSSKTDPLGNTTFMTHDANGNVSSITDPLGNTTSFSYDASGNLTSMTNPLGSVVTFTYDSSGLVTSMTDPLGRLLTNVYDSGGRLSQASNPLGQTLNYQYDTQGNPTTVLDIRGNPFTQFQYDANGRPVTAVSTTGVKTSYGYDTQGHQNAAQFSWVNPEDSNDVRVLSTQAMFDKLGRITNAVGPTGLSTTFVHNDFNQPLQSTDIRGNVTQNTYDIKGNLIETRTPDGAIRRTVYDANDRPVVELNPFSAGQNAYGTIKVYDAAGRLVSSQLWSNVVVELNYATNAGVVMVTSRLVSAGGIISSNQITYNAGGRVVAQVDGQGRNVQWEYDAAGQRTAVIDAAGNRTEFEYDAAGQATLMRDPSGHEMNFLRDKLGRVTRVVFPDGTLTQTVRDEVNNRKTKIDELGHSRELDYDAAGRMVGAVLPAVPDPEKDNALTQPSTQNEYDSYGNVRKVVDAKGRTTRFVYDQFNRLISRQLPGGQTESQSYEKYGQLDKTTDFNGQVTQFGYDPLGRITQKKLYAAGQGSPGATVAVQYDAVGRVSQITDDRGAIGFTYDLQNRVIQVDSPEGTIHYEFDDLTGLKTRIWTSNSDTRYGYDQGRRLQTITVLKRNGEVLTQPEVTSYSYDRNGNRQSVTLPHGVSTQYQYDSRYRLTALTQLDASSNLLAAYSYTLDATGRRIAAREVKQAVSGQMNTNSFAFAFDALGRITAETNVFSGTNNYGFTALYSYDLAGNRLSRQVMVGSKALTTSYAYDVNDRLLSESNNVTTVAARHRSGLMVDGIIETPVPPSAVPYYVLKAIPYLLAAAFFLPAAVLLRRRGRVRIFSPDLNPARALLPRCLAGFLASVMLVASLDTRVLADEASLYAALSTAIWGQVGSVTTYEYDANGSVTRKVTTGPNPETVVYTCNLENRLTSVSSTSTNAGQTVVETTAYSYDPFGNRVRSESHTLANGAETSGSTNLFLVDTANLTGLPQVLEELPAVGAKPNISYTMGVDIIAQNSQQGGLESTRYFLRDGHGSTRQLVDSTGALADSYAYDAFGVMLGDQAAASSVQTHLLYTGDYYDTALKQYNLRARNYDPATGRFSSMDPLLGSPDDPPTLHKYIYASSDPVNRIDPTGQQDLVEVMAAVCVIGVLATLGNTIWNAANGRDPYPDAAMWGVSFTGSLSGALNFLVGLGSIIPPVGLAGAIGYGSPSVILTALLGAPGGDIGSQLEWMLGLEAGGFLASGLIDLVASFGFTAQNSVAQLTYTLGTELLATVRDRVVSQWVYHGPGLNLGRSLGTGSLVGASMSLYGGTVWHVPKHSDYAGPFISVSGSFPIGEIGGTVGWFRSVSDPSQNGVMVGVSAGWNEGSSPWGLGGGYYPYSERWHTDGANLNGWGISFDVLLALTMPLGWGVQLILKSHHLL
jgi:RHS repeat-associated protein